MNLIQNSFNLSLDPVISLPTMVSINDLRNVVFYLKKKPQGISVAEITDIFSRRLFEPCKLLAYQTWGIVSFQNNKVSLSPLGLNLAKHLAAEAGIYREVIKNISPYQSVLEWLAQSKIKLITYLEIIKFWNENHPQSFCSKDEKAGENCVISFFQLCQSAELGLATVGRKGQPTRFIIDHEELKSFLETPNNFNQERDVSLNGQKNIQTQSVQPTQSASKMRLFVSCGHKDDFSQSVREILEITDIPFDLQIRVAEEMLPSLQTYKTMQECTAAIIIADEKNQVLCGGSWRFNDRLLSEIAASYALFERRVLLLWKGSKIPKMPFTNLQTAQLPDEMDWQIGLELSRRIKGFKYLDS